MERYDVVVAGGGLTAAKAVEAYRESGGEGTVLVLDGELHPPYHRPALSKRLMRGEQEPEQTFVHPVEWYAEQGIELRRGTRAEALDLGGHSVTAGGGEIGFGQLLIATGALPRTREGAYALRTIDDSLAIREAARAAGRATVIGTGFIGLEVTASTACARGRGHARHRRPAALRELRLRRLLGVPRRPLPRPRRDGRRVGAGGRRLAGRRRDRGRPRHRLARGLGSRARRRRRRRRALPHLRRRRLRRGDVARFHDPVFGHARRIEHWSNANYQGAEAGKVLSGAGGGYDTVSSFFTELFGTTFRVIGELSGESELEGSFEAGRAIVRYRTDGRLAGAHVTGLEDDEIDELKSAVRDAAAASRS